PLVEQQTEFPTNNPAVIGEAFAPDLLGAAAFTHRMDQLDAVGVDDAEHGRGGQEHPRPVLMGLEETKEPGALGQPWKQRPIIAGQRPIGRAVADAFEGMQQPQRDHLTGPEVRLRMFGDGAHLLIDLVEQGRDKIEGDHGLLRAWQGVTLSTSVEEVHDHNNTASKYHRVSLVCQRLTPLVSNNRDNVELRAQYLALRAAPVPPQLGFKQSAFTIHDLAD